MATEGLKKGIYEHYKGKRYEVLDEVTHSETGEPMVLYKMLYATTDYPEGSLWVRPKAMFFENIVVEERSVPRFKWISS